MSTYVFLGPCHLKLSKTKQGLLGADAPECNADGTFKAKKCHSSTGYCWCVDSMTGNEIQGTKKGPSEGEAKCGMDYFVTVLTFQYLSP